MKTGLFFGTFNPVHHGHLIVANYMTEFTDLQEVWMIVSPHNPLKTLDSLLNEQHRFDLLKMAIGDYKKISVSDIEFGLPKPSYTIHTLSILKEKYPGNEFVLIMGSDNLETFKKWKSYKQILSEYEIYVYPRISEDTGELKNHHKVKFISAPLVEISSTFIRNSIRENKDVRFMLPEKVLNQILKNHYYDEQ